MDEMKFEDANGVALRPGDKVEYWSNTYKDWVPASVDSIEFYWTEKGIKCKFFVLPDKPVNNTQYRRYVGNTRQKLSKPENVRKLS